jgi:hypothetical protein
VVDTKVSSIPSSNGAAQSVLAKWSLPGPDLALGRHSTRSLTRAAVTFRSPTKTLENNVQLMHLNYLLAFDGIIASRAGIPLIEHGAIIGAIGCSGGTDSQDEVASNADAAEINKLPAGMK